MGGRVDEKHAQQHDVSSDTTRLSIVDLKGDLWSDLCDLDIVEAARVSTSVSPRTCAYSLDVMGCGVSDGEYEHSVCDLSVEPHRLVKRKPSDLGPNHSKNVSAHRHNNDHGVDRQHETSTS